MSKVSSAEQLNSGSPIEVNPLGVSSSQVSPVDFNGRPFHFIGIGGIGMSALAYILAKRNLPVSGSDIRLNHITQRLQDLGVHIFLGQESSNLAYFQPPSPSSNALPQTYLPHVICSTAIGPSNAEYQAALDLGCPIYHRSDLLAALFQHYKGIAVAGTHGKTTTSGLVGCMLLDAGLDPTVIIGGEVSAWQGNARLGQSSYLVAEADESDGSLVKFHATLGVITNIELDHPDHYSTLDDVIATFNTFTQHCQKVIACLDCPTIRQKFTPDITYSLYPETGATYWVTDVDYGAEGTTALVWEKGECLGPLHLALLGQHNLSNALAAVAVGRQVGLDFSQIADGLATFQGARRRFESYGEYHQIQFIDDYAHHPSEVEATLKSARLRAQGGRVIAVFQPHRYSRTMTFLSEFAQAFGDADEVVITDIYGAGEANPNQVTGQLLVEAIAQHHPHVHYRAELATVQSFLQEFLQPGDLTLFLGAGNLNQIIPAVSAFFQNVEQTVKQSKGSASGEDAT